MSAARVSIIVCTYNKAGLLGDCLESLARQTADKSLYAVMVVDNNSSDGTKDIIERYASRLPGFQYIFEPKQGLSHARNRGWREAHTDWVAYIDDDARALEDYLERMIYVMDNFTFDCFGGPCIPLFDNRPKWYLDSYCDTRSKADVIGELPGNLFVDGFSCVLKRDVLQNVGGFSGTIGMTGRKIAYGEETLIQIKIKKQGGKIGFDPQMLVYHYIDKHKLICSWFFKSAFANGRDSWETFDTPVTAREVWNSFVSFFTTTLKRGGSSLGKLPDKNYYIENFLIDAFGLSAWFLGRAKSGAVRLISKRN